MKYKCKACEHEFDGLSFINKCEKCGSDNIYRKSQKSSNTIWIILLIIVVVLGGIICNGITDDGNGKDKKQTYSAVVHKIENFNEIHFYLVRENTQDMIDYDSNEHNWLKLEITHKTRNYTVEDNTIYPCNAKTIRYHWDNTDLMKTDKSFAYIDKSEFSEDFTVSNKAECPVEWRIIMVEPRLDEDCNFIVTTDHPDNLQPELSESTKKDLRSAGVSESDIKTFKNTDLSYYTKGKKIIKISISGKNGPYEFKNKWKFERGMELDIWAVATDSPNDTKRYDMPVAFDTNSTCLTNKSNEDEVEETNNNDPKDYKELNRQKKQEVILHYSGILNDVENNWDGVYKFSGDVEFNGETAKSSAWAVMSAIDNGERVVVKDVICIQGKVVKVILEIK